MSAKDMSDSLYKLSSDVGTRRKVLDCAIDRYGVERLLWRLKRIPRHVSAIDNENLEDDISYIKSKQSPVGVDRIHATMEEEESVCRIT